MPRYELPEDLSPEEERAVIAALEQMLSRAGPTVRPWALAGRIEALGLGRLQARRHTAAPWRFGIDLPFSRRGMTPLIGRGDAR